jgi:hypothetical protein
MHELKQHTHTPSLALRRAPRLLCSRQTRSNRYRVAKACAAGDTLYFCDNARRTRSHLHFYFRPEHAQDVCHFLCIAQFEMIRAAGNMSCETTL